MMLIIYLTIGILVYYVLKDEEIDRRETKEICINCGKEVEIDNLDCPDCKEKLKKFCEKCGKLIDINWRSCPFCDCNQQIEKLGGK